MLSWELLEYTASSEKSVKKMSTEEKGHFQLSHRQFLLKSGRCLACVAIIVYWKGIMSFFNPMRSSRITQTHIAIRWGQVNYELYIYTHCHLDVGILILTVTFLSCKTFFFKMQHKSSDIQFNKSRPQYLLKFLLKTGQYLSVHFGILYWENYSLL